MSYLVDIFTQRNVFTALKNPLKMGCGFWKVGRGWKAFCHQWKPTKHRQHKREQPQNTSHTKFEGTGTHESQREKNNNIYKDKKLHEKSCNVSK
jgi:hypothetical protein